MLTTLCMPAVHNIVPCFAYRSTRINLPSRYRSAGHLGAVEWPPPERGTMIRPSICDATLEFEPGHCGARGLCASGSERKELFLVEHVRGMESFSYWV